VHVVVLRALRLSAQIMMSCAPGECIVQKQQVNLSAQDILISKPVLYLLMYCRNTLVPLLRLLPLVGPSVYLLLRPKTYGSSNSN
jgi:hypothetical protein